MPVPKCAPSATLITLHPSHINCPYPVRYRQLCPLPTTLVRHRVFWLGWKDTDIFLTDLAASHIYICILWIP